MSIPDGKYISMIVLEAIHSSHSVFVLLATNTALCVDGIYLYKRKFSQGKLFTKSFLHVLLDKRLKGCRYCSTCQTNDNARISHRFRNQSHYIAETNKQIFLEESIFFYIPMLRVIVRHRRRLSLDVERAIR